MPEMQNSPPNMAALVNPVSTSLQTFKRSNGRGGGSGGLSVVTSLDNNSDNNEPCSPPPPSQHAGVLQSAAVTAAAEAAATSITSNQQQYMTSDETAQFEADKRLIYKHPLFPLLALLFEKCELATQSSECPSTESFNLDIQAFVQHQDRERKPFFTDDHEVNDLMIKAIQVLRIHMLELEKVQELCKDFCNRYITCLKGKMQSENLLRSDYGGYDSDDSSSGGHGMGGGGSGRSSVQGPPPHPGLLANPQAAAAAAAYYGHPGAPGPHHLNAISTSGIVLNQYHYHHHEEDKQFIQHHYYQQQTTSSPPPNHIDGSTPIGCIGSNPYPSPTNEPTISIPPPIQCFEDDDDFYGRKKSKRGVLPKHATNVMRSWLFQHIVHPYPTEDEKRQISKQTNLSILQVNNWFINARRRILQPMLDASNPPPNVSSSNNSISLNSSHKMSNPRKIKNGKTSVQRFWPESIVQNFYAKFNHTSIDSDESEDLGAPIDGNDENHNGGRE